MQTRLSPYIGFKSNTREAMRFYKTVFGGKLDMNTFSEFPGTGSEAEADHIMHAALETENGLMFMASDTPENMTYTTGSNISMSLSGDNEEELRGYWNKLTEGGTVVMPLEKAPWGDTFGVLRDKFGVNWMVDIAPSQS